MTKAYAWLPHIKDSIINIVGDAGREGMENLVTYWTAKFAIRGFTEALARELPEIKVSAVNEDPASFNTAINSFLYNRA